MSEVRYSLPYVSHLVITQRPTQSLKPAGLFNEQGQELARNVIEYPGIMMELTTYIITSQTVDGTTTTTSKKGPAISYDFKYKSFWQKAKQELEAIPTRNESEETALSKINALLNNSNVLWVEDALSNANLGEFMTLWYDVFSDALDEFPSMNQDTNIQGGIPLYIKPMQWDIRVPYESNKVVTLKTGAYIKDNDVLTPEIIELRFEDDQTKQGRLNTLKQYDEVIARFASELAELEEGSEAYSNKERDLNNATVERDRMAAVEYRTISDLLEHQSVQTSLVQVLLSLIGAAAAKDFPTLNMEFVQSRLIETLSTIR